MISRRGAVAFGWVATVVLAFGIGLWVAGPGRMDHRGGSAVGESSEARSEAGSLSAEAFETSSEGALESGPAAAAADEASTSESPPGPPQRPAPVAPPPSRPERTAGDEAAAPREPEAAVPQQTATPPEVPASSATSVIGAAARSSRADRLAEGGKVEDARLEAEALLTAHESFTGLTAALIEDGHDELQARLNALRIVQLAGFESEATKLARELKRSHAGTPEVLESIRRWRLLVPRITRLDTSIDDGERVLVTGTLENPDIGEVRRVRVQVEALDAAGSVLTTTRTRVRPKRLAPGSTGSFTVRFDDLVPASVLRARATVVEWESEVLGPG